ncbi:hypothetical protein G5714_007757 [Onychostoma macrolepis]|uniref:RGS domain-containing protein n=1 Tax=Onychostoma macrolepis TaxID=369639 RepID=A0A7J6CTT7_9TELE|nr:hypothetical protein G5714_007757 [Onychostoma macrolepis]
MRTHERITAQDPALAQGQPLKSGVRQRVAVLLSMRPGVQTDRQEDVDTNQMPQLTLEEVHTWGESFERLIKSAQGRVHFRQFLKTEFSEENLMFWLACEDLKKETNKTMVEQTVKQMYEDYVSVLSPKEVSLDSHAREVISRNMLEPSSCTFDEAQQQIYMLMQRDSYPRYMNSSMYADLIHSLEQINEP